MPVDLPDAAMVAATEDEVRRILEERLACVGAPALGDYLDRVGRGLARRIDGAPRSCRVVLIDDDSLETLALPSGTLLVSVGMIAALEDEAELAFMLGHELAQAASGDAARRLVRLGLQEVARERREVGGGAWAEAALDLVKLGYGNRQELDADRRAVQAMVDQGYDPQSAIRFLRRVEARSALGEEQVAEYVLAHPPPLERLRRVESMLAASVDPGPGRVNRELFRRAAGHHVLTTELTPVRESIAGRGETFPGGATGLLRRPLVGVGLGLLIVLLIYVLLDALL